MSYLQACKRKFMEDVSKAGKLPVFPFVQSAYVLQKVPSETAPAHTCTKTNGMGMLSQPCLLEDVGLSLSSLRSEWASHQ